MSRGVSYLSNRDEEWSFRQCNWKCSIHTVILAEKMKNEKMKRKKNAKEEKVVHCFLRIEVCV